MPSDISLSAPQGIRTSMCCSRASWPTIERRATGGKSGVKTTAGGAAAECLTESANADMIEVLLPRVNSGGGAEEPSFP